MTNDNSTFSEERLNKIALRARLNKAIMLWDLSHIMAAEETYNNVLFELWEALDLNSDEYKSSKEIYRDGRLDKHGNLKFKGDRAGVWWHIWMRLAKTGGGEQFHSRNLAKIVPITLYYDAGGGLRKVMDGNERKDGHFVKLDDLANFLKNIEKHYGLSIPLPTRLFPVQEHVPLGIQTEWVTVERAMQEFYADRFVDGFVDRHEFFNKLVDSDPPLPVYETDSEANEIDMPLGLFFLLDTEVDERGENTHFYNKTFPWYFLKRTDWESFKEKYAEKIGIPQTGPLPYERKEDTKPLSTEIIDLIQKVKPEIEIIYTVMKKGVGFSGRMPDPEIKYQQKAEEVFTKQKNNFKLIKSEYLKDQSIYSLNPGQSKRDFVGALLKKIVQDKTGETFGGQKLYDQYKLD